MKLIVCGSLEGKDGKGRDGTEMGTGRMVDTLIQHFPYKRARLCLYICVCVCVFLCQYAMDIYLQYIQTTETNFASVRFAAPRYAMPCRAM